MNINLTLIGQSISFFLFVVFCMKFVWPPIMKALDDRKAKIAEGLAAAERGHHDKELAQKHAKDVLHKAKEQAADIVSQAQRRASEIVVDAKTDARDEGARLLEAAQVEIEQERVQAREALRKEVVALALQGTAQILGREVDVTAHNEVLEQLGARL